MLDYSKFPPINYFYKALKHCPQSALLFANLWEGKDHKGHLTVDKLDVRNHFNITPTMFRNLCLELVDEEILEIDENDKYYFVDIIVQ
jgi:hypothetical protein